MKTLLFLIALLTTFFYSAQSQVNWESTMDIAPSTSGNNHPRIVTDASGNPLVIWFHANRAMFTRWNGVDFDSPKLVNPSSVTVAGASWMGPDIAAKGDTVYVVYKETPEDVGHIWCVHSYDGGLTFSDPVQVDFIADSLSRFPTVTTDKSGNPIIAFMKFNSAFLESRWVVARSNDFGNSFLPDVLASGWSSSTSVVCDCCPGSIVNSDDVVAMMYRDNNSNIRDSWAGFSLDGGISFTSGANMDQHNWMIMACPASGPDGVILGDTLYSTFMNAAGGKSRVYLGRTSLLDFNALPSQLLTGSISGLSLQNYPRISGSGKTLAVVWKQFVNSKDQCVINFYEDITSGLAPDYDTLATNGITSTDVTIWNDKIFVVWEDYLSGTVKFRAGSFEISTGVKEMDQKESISVFPNPSSDTWTISGEFLTSLAGIKVYDINGNQVYSKTLTINSDHSIEIANAGWSNGIYFLRFTQDKRIITMKLVKM